MFPGVYFPSTYFPNNYWAKTGFTFGGVTPPQNLEVFTINIKSPQQYTVQVVGEANGITLILR